MIRCWPVIRAARAVPRRIWGRPVRHVGHRHLIHRAWRWHPRPHHVVTWVCAAGGAIAPAAPALIVSPPPIIVPTAGPAILASGTGGWLGGWPEGGGAWGAGGGWFPTESAAGAFQGSPQPGLLPLIPSSTIENAGAPASASHPVPEPSGASVLAFGLAAVAARSFISARRGA